MVASPDHECEVNFMAVYPRGVEILLDRSGGLTVVQVLVWQQG